MGHTQPVWSVAFAPEGPFAVSGAADGIILWDIPSGTDVQRLIPDGIPFAMAISPDGQTVVIGEEQGVVQVGQGSLYPALHRLERRGWVRAEWAPSDNNRNAKYYELTRTGRKQLEAESEAWRALSRTIGQILDMT
jgi:hypothetical protein